MYLMKHKAGFQACAHPDQREAVGRSTDGVHLVMGLKYFRGIDVSSLHMANRPCVRVFDPSKTGYKYDDRAIMQSNNIYRIKKERENSAKVSKCVYPQIVGYWRLVGDQGIQPFCNPARYDHSSALSVFHAHINQPFDFS